MTLQEIDWTKLGQALRASAMEAPFENLPSVESAYQFLLDNPESFDREEWSPGMPLTPPLPLIAAYYTPDAPAVQAPAAPTEDEYVWIKIGIRATKDGEGWDLKLGDDKERDVNGSKARELMHAYCDDCVDALQSVIDQAEPNVGDDRDMPDEYDEPESDRNSGCLPLGS